MNEEKDTKSIAVQKETEALCEDVGLDAAGADTEEIDVILTQDPLPSAAEEADGMLTDMPDINDLPAEDSLRTQEEDRTPDQTSAESGYAPAEASEQTPVSDGIPEDIPGTAEKADAAEAPLEEYRTLGLYLHVPFCKSKCAYCDFYSTDKIVCTGSGRRAPEEMKLYCHALKNQMRMLSERTTQYNVDTVFIGGGTPTALPPKLLIDLVREVERDFYLSEDCEFTVEMNPATTDDALLKKLRRAGVNRLSIGLQSAHNHELAAMSRIHTVGDFTEAFQSAREAGFDNINIDVMYGIPEQTKESFLETLSFVCSMKPEHISMYNLRIEDGTPFGEKKHMLPLPDEDTECEMYFEGIAYLESMGYAQYEISNFAREGYACRHNLKYWHGEEYLGCGPAAHSFFGGKRFSLRRALAQYCRAFEQKTKNIPASLLDENYTIDEREAIAEYIMLRLRLKEGIDANDFRARFNGDFDAVFGPRLQVYIDNGFMVHEGSRYAFTPRGMFVSNYILSRIIPFDVKHVSVNH